MPQIKTRALLQGAACFFALFATAAAAQSAGSAAKPNSTIPEKQHLGPVDSPPKHGVIKPKENTDPEMTKKPPPQSPSETPVIPPSATPGGSEAK